MTVSWMRAVHRHAGKPPGPEDCLPEEIAWRSGYIGDAQLAALAKPLSKNGYGQYLQRLLHEPKE
ncbi:hypothetical protein [Comamonas sp. JC664]|uniref:hypothetical protein n=1 Tax=Comamonas sp. JC664 TaxID=2801917 RepID=UPI00361AB2F3